MTAANHRRGSQGVGRGLSLAERLYAHLEPRDSGCLEWTGHTLGATRDRGRIYCPTAKKQIYVYRAAWELEHGPIPDGMLVCHKCDNGLCCNVKHLFLGTHADNMRDMKEKDRRKGKGGSRGEAHNMARLTEQDVRAIRAEYRWRSSDANQYTLAEKYGVNPQQIGRIVRGERWGHVA